MSSITSACCYGQLFDAERIEGPFAQSSAVIVLCFAHSRHSPRCFRVPASFSIRCCSRHSNWPIPCSAGEATSLCAVPTIIRNLFELFGEPSSPAFSKLEALYCFGAPMAPAEKIRAKTSLCANFVQVYGASICGRISTLSGADLEARPDTLGRVLPHVTLQLVDADDKILPAGEAGVIRLRSPGMARSIYGGIACGSGDSFKGGWAYPGDIGAIDTDGFLQLLGRTSDLIIRGGANVHPAEVEVVIAECEGVRDVAVVGFTKLPEGEEIAAFVVGADTLTEAALVAHCRVRLGPDKRPRKFVFVKDLPRNANGKISRAELRQQLEATS